MHAIEFVTKIDNGIVQVPKEYKQLQQAGKARIIILFDEGQESSAAIPKRSPHADIAGKVQILGDIMSTAPETDWDLQK